MSVGADKLCSPAGGALTGDIEVPRHYGMDCDETLCNTGWVYYLLFSAAIIGWKCDCQRQGPCFPGIKSRRDLGSLIPGKASGGEKGQKQI